MVTSGDHLYAAWFDDSEGQRRVRLQRFHRNGTIANGWGPTAMQVNAGTTSTDVRMIGHGSSGVYLAWVDASRARGVRILEDGSTAPGWSAAGTPLLDPRPPAMGWISRAMRIPEWS
jgi:hypothetical protein